MKETLLQHGQNVSGVEGILGAISREHRPPVYNHDGGFSTSAKCIKLKKQYISNVFFNMGV